MVFDSEFDEFRRRNRRLQGDSDFVKISKDWFQKSVEVKYSYNFDWLGVPVIQMPSDLVIFQSIVFESKPDLIIETGVARGGSLIFWASIMEICGLRPNVIGIDIEIRGHTHEALKSSRYSEHIHLVESDSTDNSILKRLADPVRSANRIMVVLDSNHSHQHVLKELSLYSPLVTSNNYLLILDTVIDELVKDPSRDWGPGNSPMSAVKEFMKDNPEFTCSEDWINNSIVSVAPYGIWRKI